MTQIQGHSKFPLKVYNRIIDMLAEETSNAALCTCLSVSRSFRHHARIYLFRTIRIDDVGTQFRTQRMTTTESAHHSLELLVDLICPPTTGGQGILPYIREVEFTFSKHPSLYSSGSGYSRLPPSQCLEYALTILRWLNTSGCWVRSLQIDGSGGVWYGSWLALDPDIRSALLDLRRSPTLSTLHLRYMTHVPADILQGTVVANLTSHGVRWSPSRDGKLLH